MEFRDFIRGFFGLRPRQRDNCEDCIRKPECKWSEDGINILVDDPFFIISAFQQMEDVFRNAFSFHSDFPSLEGPFTEERQGLHNFFSFPGGNVDIFIGGDHDHEGLSEFPGIDPHDESRNPRDLVLKPSYKDSPVLKPWDRDSLVFKLWDRDSTIWKPWDSDSPNSVEPAQHRDSDLDGSHASDILREFPQPSKSKRSFTKSVSTRIIRGADGTVEEHRTVKDSSGNEVTTVHKSIGDQSYTVTVHSDSKGLNEKREDFVNLDEKDILQFEERWNKLKGNVRVDFWKEPDLNSQGDSQYSSFFRKLLRF